MLTWVSSNYMASARTILLFLFIITACSEFIFQMRMKIHALIQTQERNDALYHSLMEYSLQGITIFQRNRIVYSNKAFASMLERKVEEIIDMDWEGVQVLVHPDDRQMVWNKTHERLNQLRGPEQYVYRLLTKRGEPVWVIIFATPIEYKGEHAVQAVYINISEQKKIEAALRKSEEHFRLVEEAAQVGSWDWDVNEQSATQSNQMKEILGVPTEQESMSDREFLDIIHHEDYEKVQELVKSVINSEEKNAAEFRILHPTLGVRWVLFKGRLVSGTNENKKRMVGICIDITERKKIEEERERLIQKLSDAVLNIRRLSGLLPICSSCKKIRDDEGYWSEVEDYIHDHTEADFT
ncbi:PAS domain S-box protein, partial [bacterium]|nr:PAS domain S-box protein [bacterium]